MRFKTRRCAISPTNMVCRVINVISSAPTILTPRCALQTPQISKQRVETETSNTNKVEATAKEAEEELQQREAELK